MLRLLLLIALFVLPFCRPAEAQAVLTTYNVPTVMTVTVGAYQCTFWFHDRVAQPYDSEVACYDGNNGTGAPEFIAVLTAAATFVGSWNFTQGSITWEIHPNNPVSTVSLSAVDPSDPGGVLLFSGTF